MQFSQFNIFISFFFNSLFIPSADNSIEGILVVHKAVVSQSLYFLTLLNQFTPLDSSQISFNFLATIVSETHQSLINLAPLGLSK
jgi:hypothetical protein